VLPKLPSNEKNSFDHHNSYNKGPNLVFFSFTESPSNFLLTIKFPKNHITSSYQRNLPETAKAIFGHQRALGINPNHGSFLITFPQSNIHMNLNNIITKLNIALMSTCGPHP
jgi:hypothetical protein